MASLSLSFSDAEKTKHAAVTASGQKRTLNPQYDHYTYIPGGNSLYLPQSHRRGAQMWRGFSLFVHLEKRESV